MNLVKTPHELWQEAAGDPERYLELMREAGHIVDRCAERGGPNGARCDREVWHQGRHTYGHDIFGHRRAAT